MNQCTIIGNLTSDPELRQTQSGKSVVKFTVAVNNGKDADGNDRPADFITCQAWEKKADFVAKWWKKGKPIALTGAFKTDKYQDKNHDDVTHYNSYILVNNVEFVGKPDGNSAQAAPQATTTSQIEEILSDDEIPF